MVAPSSHYFLQYMVDGRAPLLLALEQMATVLDKSGFYGDQLYLAAVYRSIYSLCGASSLYEFSVSISKSRARRFAFAGAEAFHMVPSLDAYLHGRDPRQWRHSIALVGSGQIQNVHGFRNSVLAWPR